jgi:hypothetical protein
MNGFGINQQLILIFNRHSKEKIGLEPIPVGDERMERAKIHFPRITQMNAD